MRIRSVVLLLALLVGVASTTSVGLLPRIGHTDGARTAANEPALAVPGALTADEAVAFVSPAERTVERTWARWTGWLLLGFLVLAAAAALATWRGARRADGPADRARALAHHCAPERAPPVFV